MPMNDVTVLVVARVAGRADQSVTFTIPANATPGVTLSAAQGTKLATAVQTLINQADQTGTVL